MDCLVLVLVALYTILLLLEKADIILLLEVYISSKLSPDPPFSFQTISLALENLSFWKFVLFKYRLLSSILTSSCCRSFFILFLRSSLLNYLK